MKQHFRLETHPVADPANVVRGDRYRIVVDIFPGHGHNRPQS